QARDRGLDFLPRAALAARRHGVDASREFRRACRKVLGDVIENLAAIVSGRARPTLCGRVCRFHGIADILAIPFRYLADHVTARRINAARVSLVGPRLFAGDEELWS